MIILDVPYNAMVLPIELPSRFWLFHGPVGIPGAAPQNAGSVPRTSSLNSLRFSFYPAPAQLSALPLVFRLMWGLSTDSGNWNFPPLGATVPPIPSYRSRIAVFPKFPEAALRQGSIS
ncbi:hypothetical protein [Algoriphagus resistens]|uniref:hypothetical protein n=1 Tax=Algoriphagus resistens TaxID=1750590 RepID=UPI000716B305|nr:hypothetical protein [Algoriphagus resistens]